MISETVMDRQVAGQSAVPFLGVLEGHRVGPLPGEGLNESLRHAVGSERVGHAYQPALKERAKQLT